MTSFPKKYHTVLSIAGSDSIGGAGIQADIKTCCSIGTYAMTAVTAVTAQNTLGVKGFTATPSSMLRLQLETILSDIVPDAVKIGMIPDAVSAEIIADTLSRYNLRNIVTDPVMVATSGHSLSDAEVKPVLLNRIIPLSAVVTPNIPEAEALTGMKINNSEDAVKAGQMLAQSYRSTAVLIKGGHCPDGNFVNDYLCRPDEVLTFSHPYVETRNTHGTGCSLSSAIASFIAIGNDVDSAVRSALEWESRAIEAGAFIEFGSPDGHGPINHLFKILK